MHDDIPDREGPPESDDALRNVERLLGRAYRPDTPHPEAVRRVQERLQAEAATLRGPTRADTTRNDTPRPRGTLLFLQRAAALAASAAVLVAAALLGRGAGTRDVPQGNMRETTENGAGHVAAGTATEGLVPRALPPAPPSATLAVGDVVRTGPAERRRTTLPDGTVLYVNSGSEVHVEDTRTLRVTAGEVYVEVARDPAHPFRVATPQRTFTALGTRFGVDAGRDAAAALVVTHGRVAASGVTGVVTAGQQLAVRDGRTVVETAERVSHVVDWTRDLAAAAASPLVPASDYEGGALVALDPWGQSMRLSLRRYHVDVHIEDGFARTTIDQTWFNHANWRLEGTFYFPLPADASLSRLAMYVAGRRMEGGMAERERARDVYEQIVTRRKDPALLEWVDGSTFKMRVFPLEAREEKRILLSYVQRLPALYGETTYRFPAARDLGVVGDWSFAAHVAGGADARWRSDATDLRAQRDGTDLVLDAARHGEILDRDLVLRLRTPDAPAAGSTSFRSFEQDGARWLMVRHRPELPRERTAARRDWVVLFESSGARDPLLARAQVELVRELLALAEEGDRFAIVTAATRTRALTDTLLPATRENVAAAVRALEHTHLVGAFDLGAALDALRPFTEDTEHAVVVHVGSGVATLGERDAGALAKRVPAGAEYVGLAVGRRWSRTFMKAAAARTGGLYAQVDPTEPLAWRAFELRATLDTPRVLDAHVVDDAESASFLTFEDAVADGEELVAVTKLDAEAALPSHVTLAGSVGGKPWSLRVPVADVRAGAGYLPRQWARLEIERLVADDADAHKAEIVALSKAMYVMSPFTSLLVLEDEAMYEQFHVDRGRSDHWALYPAPETIDVVREPLGTAPTADAAARAGDPRALLGTILMRLPPRLLQWNGAGWRPIDGYRGTALSVQQMLDIAAQPSPYGYGVWGGPLYRQDFDMESPFAGSSVNGVIGVGGGAGGGFGGPETGGGSGGSGMFERVEQLRETRDDGRFGWLGFRGGIGWNGGGAGGLLDSPWRTMTWDARVPMAASGILTVTGGSTVDGEFLSWRGGDYRARIENLFETSAPASSATRAQAPMGFPGIGLDGRDLLGNGRRSISADSFLLGRVVVTRSGLEAAEKSARQSGVRDLVGRMWNNNLYGLLQYQRPYPTNDQRVFSDLLAYAPGMNTTWVDVRAVLEREGGTAPERGTVDAAAAKLLERARTAGWLRVGSGDGDLAYDVLVDGAGRLRIDRTLRCGLREIVVADGTTLLHLYPDLGVGARRTLDRHLRAQIAALVPWSVASSDDLAIGADVRALDASTVEIVPLADGAPRTRLVFGADGLLAERHVLVDGRVAASQRYTRRETEVDVATNIDTAREQSTGVVGVGAAAAAAPDLAPALGSYVVLELPYRTREHVVATRHLFEKTTSDPATWSEGDALALLAADFATNTQEAHDVVRKRFLARKDARPGLGVVLRAGTPGEALEEALAPSSTPLGRYLGAVAKWQWNTAFELPQADDGFFGDLEALARTQARWMSGLANQDRDAAVQQSLAATARLREPAMRYAAIASLWNWGAVQGDAARTLAQLLEPLEDEPGLRYVARYDRAAALHAAGDTDAAATAFAALHAEALAEGSLAPFEWSMVNALRGADAEAWRAGWLEAAADWCAHGRRELLPYAALQLTWTGDQQLGEELLQLALADCPKEERESVTLAAVETLWSRSEHVRADALVQGLLADPALVDDVALLDVATLLADARGASARAARYAERALELRFRALPDVLDLSAVRQQYGMLLARYQQVATAVETLDDAVPDAFVARVVAAADRWRALDDDPSGACLQAAQILRRVGRADLAWDYLTTPLALRPNESQPWLQVAQQLVQAGDIELADRCYATAFEIEPTNAQILWDRAQMLLAAGRSDRARDVWRVLADGTWQPRFEGLSTQARTYLGR